MSINKRKKFTWNRKLYDSGFENQFHNNNPQLIRNQEIKLKYSIEHTYTPDFIYRDTYFETKGFFDSDDRKKILEVCKQHPTIKLCLIFYRSASKIRKGSNTSYADWCDKHGINYCEPETDVTKLYVPTYEENLKQLEITRTKKKRAKRRELIQVED